MKNRASLYRIIFGRFVISKLFSGIDEPENPESVNTELDNVLRRRKQTMVTNTCNILQTMSSRAKVENRNQRFTQLQLRCNKTKTMQEKLVKS